MESKKKFWKKTGKGTVSGICVCFQRKVSVFSPVWIVESILLSLPVNVYVTVLERRFCGGHADSVLIAEGGLLLAQDSKRDKTFSPCGLKLFSHMKSLKCPQNQVWMFSSDRHTYRNTNKGASLSYLFSRILHLSGLGKKWWWDRACRTLFVC